MSSAQQPILVGITGGAATGKSSVAKKLAPLLPAEVFNSDARVHELLSSDQEIVATIRERIPTAWDGERIDRQELGRVVFADTSARSFLEDLLHPLVYRSCEENWLAAESRGLSLIAEVPLLFETAAQSRFPFVVLVAASPEIQQQRLTEIRKLTAATARDLLAAQWPNEKKIPAADYVIWNDGTEESLDRQVSLLAQRLRTKKSGSPETPAFVIKFVEPIKG